MHLPWLFARRYMFSAKSHAVINIISAVSAVAVGVPVAAMVILLSVFNGFEGLVHDMYGEFDPEVAIMPAKGKIFDYIDRERLMAVEGVDQVSMVLEDQVLLTYRDRQKEATLRGVDSFYTDVVPVDNMVAAGEWKLRLGELDQAVVGAGVAYSLDLNLQMFDPVEVVVPRRGAISALMPVDAFRTSKLYPVGVFMLDAETDGRFVMAPIDAARRLFDYPYGVSAAMIRTTGDINRTQAALKKELGPEYRVLTRYEQKAQMYTIMRYEKWGIFFIVLMVMVIASFAIVGSLVMLIIDKRPDLRIISAMGGSTAFVRGIFVREGMLIAGLGAAGGMALGLGVCWLQQSLGLVRIPARTFLVDTYPVVVRPGDIVLIVAAFFVVNFIITKFTVANAIPRR